MGNGHLMTTELSRLKLNIPSWHPHYIIHVHTFPYMSIHSHSRPPDSAPRRGYPFSPARISSPPYEDILSAPRGYPHSFMKKYFVKSDFLHIFAAES